MMKFAVKLLNAINQSQEEEIEKLQLELIKLVEIYSKHIRNEMFLTSKDLEQLVDGLQLLRPLESLRPIIKSIIERSKVILAILQSV